MRKELSKLKQLINETDFRYLEAADGKLMNINLHIERLILDGLPLGAGQGALVQGALEVELARLLMQGGIAPGLESDGAVPSVRANAIQLTAQSSPAKMGQQIAQSVYGEIGKAK